MKTELWIVRHGQSEANIQRLYGGRLDMRLTDLGRAQAEKTAAFFKDTPLDACYASDLCRAFETAEIIARPHDGLTVLPEKGLREIDGGLWEGHLYDRLKYDFPESYAVWLNDIGRAKPDGGESVLDTARRVTKTLHRLAEEHEGKTLLIVTHAVALRCFTGMVKWGNVDSLKDLPYATNASASHFEYENGVFTLLEYSIDRYMGDLRTALPKTV